MDSVNTVHAAYGAGTKCGEDEPYPDENVALAFGTTREELQPIPVESPPGLSCADPVAMTLARIKEGERILDIGCGNGMTTLLAASKVGVTGQAIGLDISRDMISYARRNAHSQNLRPPQVAFVYASLTEPLPISSCSIDCVLLNCANLLSFFGNNNLLEEVYRVIKPGGRIVFDNVVARRGPSGDSRNDPSEDVETGFSDVNVVDPTDDTEAHLTLDELLTTRCYLLPSADDDADDSYRCYEATDSQRSDPLFGANKRSKSFRFYASKPADTTSTTAEAPDPLLRWWDAYPSARSVAKTITGDEVASMIRNKSVNQSHYAIIDVRRHDHAGGHVRSSTQCAAQTFHDDLPGFFEKFGQTSKVIFYCGSSNGRGPRCAGWYQDYLNDKGTTSSEAYVLEGGVKAWLGKFEQDAELVDRD